MTNFPFQAIVQLGEQTILISPNEEISQNGYQLTFKQDQKKNGQHSQLWLLGNAHKNISSVTFTLKLPLNLQDKIFCNGFQSWSESREMDFSEQWPNLHFLARSFMRFYGDYHFPTIERGPGKLHSWSWTYWQTVGNEPIFWGSLSERDGFTLFQFDLAKQCLKISRDIAHQVIDDDFLLLDIWTKTGDLDQSFTDWFELLQITKPTPRAIKGWTSWYQFYTQIKASLLDDVLQQFKATAVELDYFQIDDGYQKWVGDWLDLKAGFADEMPDLVQRIETTGAKAGIWLAPYVAAAKSQLVAQHPDWLQKDQHGKPLKAGYNPLWKGHFYALDPLHPDLRDYLRTVFRTIIKDWGFSFIKLDFLYAACIQPLAGKNRGQICYESLQFLREIAGDTPLLGCGVPLAPGFGLFDYCRIGADIHLRWEHRLLKFFRHRERVSTQIALRTVIGRRALDGRAWRNDPDVLILRDQDQQLSITQRQTIARVNALCGAVLFHSDRPDQWGKWQNELYAEVTDLQDASLKQIKLIKKDVYQLNYVDQHGITKQLWVNLSNTTVTVGEVALAPYASQQEV